VFVVVICIVYCFTCISVTETINVSAIIHEVPKETSPVPEIPDEDEETREQRAVQEQMEALVDSLRERIEKENCEIAKLRLELAKKMEEGATKPKSGDNSDMEELTQQNQALQVSGKTST
jgi:TolA-binding protein